jgi:hypothetical protein
MIRGPHFFFLANVFFEVKRERENRRKKKDVARAKPPHETLTQLLIWTETS